MPRFSKSGSTPYECLLPDQIISNTKCSLPFSGIDEISVNADVIFNYDEIVNMQDVKKLGKVEFSDKFEILPGQKSISKFRLRSTAHLYNQGKSVNFLDKFKDPKFISDTEQWDTTIYSLQDAVKIRNKEL